MKLSDQRRGSTTSGPFLQSIVRLFEGLYSRSAEFRDFVLVSDWSRLILLALYPVIVSSDPVTADVELNSRDSTLSFDGSDVIIRPIGSSSTAAPIVRTSTVNLATSPQSTPPKGTPLKRASSFVLLTTQATGEDDSATPDGGEKSTLSHGSNSSIANAMMQLVIDVYMDQIFARKEFPGFGLFAKVPPGFQEHQAFFESYILRRVIEQSTSRIQADQKLLCEPRLITNLARLCMHLSEAIFEGWFIDGPEVLIDFSGMLLEYLQQPDIASLKSVRLCSQSITLTRSCLLRVILLKLSDLDGVRATEAAANEFMNKLAYWQM